MKKILLIALAMTASLMACPQGNCGSGAKVCGTAGSCAAAYKSGGVLDTLTYALGVMKLQDDPDIKAAIHSYKKSLRGMTYGVDMAAFKGGKFDKALYVDNSVHTKKAKAQADLFETVYLVLDEKQKVRLRQLMAAHQHYIFTLKKENPCACKGGKACPIRPSKPAR
jgi:hypothetical protein